MIDDTARYLGAACCNGPPLISARIRASFLFSSFPPPSPPFVPRVDGERGWLQFTNNRLSPCSAVIAAQVPRISIRHVRFAVVGIRFSRNRAPYGGASRSLSRRASKNFLSRSATRGLNRKYLSEDCTFLSSFLSLRPFQCANLNSDRIVIIVKQFHLDEIYDKVKGADCNRNCWLSAAIIARHRRV